MSYLDVSVGQKVAGYTTGLGRLDVMCQNPRNAVIHLGHSGGQFSGQFCLGHSGSQCNGHFICLAYSGSRFSGHLSGILKKSVQWSLILSSILWKSVQWPSI